MLCGGGSVCTRRWRRGSCVGFRGGLFCRFGSTIVVVVVVVSLDGDGDGNVGSWRLTDTAYNHIHVVKIWGEKLRN